MSGFRLPAGGLIDRSKPLGFTFEGKTYTGYAGDTLASALLANGVRVVGRSFKYHRPRGLMAAGVDEPNALVQLTNASRSDVNLRCTEVELYDGLAAKAVNCWPSVNFDIGAVNNLLNRFLPAGFYYKTFIWPQWGLFEPLIRRAAGLGKIEGKADPDRYENRYAHCDVLVVGAGPAGLAAALAASRSGARVILAEQDSLLGGSLLWEAAFVDQIPGDAWVKKTLTELMTFPETTVLSRTTVVGYFDHNGLAMVERVSDHTRVVNPARIPRHRMWQVRAKRVILGAGAMERPLVFPGNDRPGVMLASAVCQYMGRYGVCAGRNIALFTNNDHAYSTADAILDAGVNVAAVIDARNNPSAVAVKTIEARGVSVLKGAKVIGTHGSHSLEAVTIRAAGGMIQSITVDILAMSGGWSPTAHLFCQSGGKLVWDEKQALFRPGAPAQAEQSVGAAAGDLDLATALTQGYMAGAKAAAIAGFRASDQSTAPKAAPARFEGSIEALWQVNAPGKAFVDFQNDVTTADIKLAAQESFISVEHLKRYTTLGMGTDQGKTSNINALALMAHQTGRGIPETGTTKYRFPFTPAPLATLGGRARGALYHPLRHMPAHGWHEVHGAVFEEYGGWARPAYYLKPGETPLDAEQREALAVRSGVGLFEGSPLGKIEVKGPDAAAFLDRIYANTMSTLKVGKVRYGLILNELGVIIDDGVAARFAEDHFLVGTTSSGAARMGAWLEEWLQCEWLRFKVLVAPVTTSWAVVTLSGPVARQVLEAVGVDFPISAQEFPHLTFREGHVGGIPARVFRVSFTGEVTYEINVPASRGRELWEKLYAAGAFCGITPVGIDAWMLLRTEKGFLHVGADTDGTTVPDDVGWGHIMKRTQDFVGRRSLTLPDNVKSDRLQFVGLAALEPIKSFPVGAPVCKPGASKSDGYVTSAGHSPILGQAVTLAMVRGGRARQGDMVDALVEGQRIKARITPPGIYDPKGERVNG